MEKIECNNCGAEMQPIDHNYASAMKCPKCGYSWVTTNYDPKKDDKTIYSIIVQPGNSHSIDTIRAISSITGLNSVAIKSALTHAPSSLLSDNAERINIIAKELESLSIAFVIDPVFPY